APSSTPASSSASSNSPGVGADVEMPSSMRASTSSRLRSPSCIDDSPIVSHMGTIEIVAAVAMSFGSDAALSVRMETGNCHLRPLDTVEHRRGEQHDHARTQQDESCWFQHTDSRNMHVADEVAGNAGCDRRQTQAAADHDVERREGEHAVVPFEG